MPDPETFRLKWKRTWRDQPEDFIGRDPADPLSFIRVYRQKATSDPAKAWLWIVTMRGELVASGHEADGPERARPAVRAAENAWRKWRDSHSN
jgi:hypothetical protein